MRRVILFGERIAALLLAVLLAFSLCGVCRQEVAHADASNGVITYPNRGVCTSEYSEATAFGWYSMHYVKYRMGDGTQVVVHGQWAPTYHYSVADAHGQPKIDWWAAWV